MDYEDGVAYGFVTVVIFVVLGGLLLLCMTPAMNGIVDSMNLFINKSWVSTQTVDAVNWNITIFGLCGVVGLLGLFMWAVIRGIEERT